MYKLSFQMYSFKRIVITPRFFGLLVYSWKLKFNRYEIKINVTIYFIFKPGKYIYVFENFNVFYIL